jgi:2-dehydropantoate 2-reductase
MKILVVGAGGVGSYLGAKLLKDKNDVLLLSRGLHLQAIKEDALHVEDEDMHFSVSSSYFGESPKVGTVYDLIILATKSYDVAQACKDIKGFLHANSIVMCISNGVSHHEVIKSILPYTKVCEACIYILSNIIKPGTIKKYGGVFQLFIGSKEIEPKVLEDIFYLFNNAQLNTKISQNIELECWRKFLFISSFAIMTSFYDVSMGEIVAKHEEELREVLQEIVSLANKKGIGLHPKNIEQVIYKGKNNIPYNATTSMQLDFRNAKKPELEALCGYLIKEGDKLGVSLKTILSLYKWLLIKASQNT